MVKGKCVCDHRHENLMSQNKVVFELLAKWVYH